MIDRLSTFSNPQIIKLITENFIPVAENDWYQRRRQDAVGEFFRSVADQGPRKGKGGSTRQGLYALTADGKLLVYNNNRSAEKHLSAIKGALQKWKALPVSSRKPGAIKVPPLSADQLDKKYARIRPEGTVVLRTSTRLLNRNGSVFAACSAEENSHSWGHLAAHNTIWLQAEEISQLRRLGDGDLPKPIAYRLMRYHFTDNTRGEPNSWSRDDIKEYKLAVRTPTGKPNRRILEGAVSFEHGEKRGFDAKVLGHFDIDPQDDVLTEVKIVVIGDHWGSGTYTPGARPGKTPLGIAISLADVENDPAARVPPHGSGWLDGYLRADRH